MPQSRDKVVYYNGIGFAPVAARMSMVISAPAETVWATVSKFGKQALWMGSVEGQHIFTELLSGHTVDYVGAVRVFGIADKLIFEQLTRLDHQKMIMAWQGISHPLNSNPFPASFLNFKGQLQLSRVLIPGNQTFMDWRMDLLTEVHAVDYMQESMNGIMRVGLLNLQKYIAAGCHPSASLEMQIKPPEIYGISKMPQPASAAMLLHQDLRSEQSGVHNMMYAHQTYVPAPTQQSAPILSVDRTNTTANSLEQTVPLLHEAHTAKDILLGAYKTAHHQAVSGPSMLQPRVPTLAVLPSASTAQQRAAPALHPDWQQGSLQQQHSGQQQMYAALRQRQAQAQPTGQHPVESVPGAGPISQATSGGMMSMLSPKQAAGIPQSAAQSSPPMPSPVLPQAVRAPQAPPGIQRVRSGSQLSDPLLRQPMAGGLASNQAQTKSDVAQQVQVQVVGELENLSLTDVPRDRLKRSAGSFSQK